MVNQFKQLSHKVRIGDDKGDRPLRLVRSNVEQHVCDEAGWSVCMYVNLCRCQGVYVCVQRTTLADKDATKITATCAMNRTNCLVSKVSNTDKFY